MSRITLASKVWQDPLYFIAFGFGSGLMPIAPGTWGTLVAMPIYLCLAHLGWMVYLSVSLAAFVLGVFVCDHVSRDMGVHDYKGIVWDEVVGYLLTMCLVPVGWVWMLVGFVLFRVFDIWKPQPIRLIDRRVPGGLGIMLDDVVAAVFAWMVMQLLVWAFA